MTAPSAAQPMDADDSGGYTIELEVSPDGKFTVSVESAAVENAEQPGSEADEGDAGEQEFSDIKSALTAILEIVKNDGKMQPQGADEANFNAGYSAKGGQPVGM